MMLQKALLVMKSSSWLNPLGIESLQLDITAGSGASGTAYVVIQQARNY